MNNSYFFVKKIKDSKSIIIFIEFVFLVLLFVAGVSPLYNMGYKKAAVIIGASMTIFSLIFVFVYILTAHKYTKEEMATICDELDNKLEKEFPLLGLYVTKNYIVCIGTLYTPFKVFAIKIKDIEMINTIDYTPEIYYKKVLKKKNFSPNIWGTIKFVILYRIFHPIRIDGNLFEIMCNDRRYVVSSTSSFNKSRTKAIYEAADYICEKNPDIHY